MKQKQPVVVLGGGGFIGRRVVAALAATDRIRPVAVGRRVTPIDFGVDVERISLDATDQTQLQSAIAAATGVVSCIAGSPEDILLSGRALFAAAARMSSTPRVIYLSSIAAYGSATGLVAETSPLLGNLGHYSAAKAAIDKLAARYPFAVRLRPGIVYGPESAWWSDRIARLLVARRLGNLGVAGEGVCNLVHVDDVAAAVVRSLESANAAGEAFNLGAAESLTWNEYFRRYAQALGAVPVRRISRIRLAGELGVLGPALKLLEKTFGTSRAAQSNPPIRPWLTTLCRHEIRMDVAKAERLLGMQWRPIDQALRQTSAWFLDTRARSSAPRT